MFIVVLGGGVDLKGYLPSYVYQRLNKAIEIYKKIGHKNLKIIVSGKYSFLYNQLKKYPPFTEAEIMAQYLISKNIPQEKILLEKKSKDSIGNAYYLKKNFFLPKKINRAIIITSNFHLPRIKFIFQKIFGSAYKFDFVGVQENLPKEEEKKVIERQKQLLEKTKNILKEMKNGDHNFLKGKLYHIKYYREKRPYWVINFVAKGK